VSAIEINATYYKLQRPELFERWAAEVPDGFLFAVKASRFCTNRRVLAEGREGIERFCGQGFTRLGPKLGPILWQFMETKTFDPDDIEAFFELLPREQDGVRLRHAVEVRHESFRDPRFVALARAAGVAICCDDSESYPQIADPTADFVYARLMRAREEEAEGYPPAELDHWAQVARSWAGGRPDGLDPIGPAAAPLKPRHVFLFMINGAKIRAPTAAQALIARL
jgi:uncharacterized protein YecE (DUF72 family)